MSVGNINVAGSDNIGIVGNTLKISVYGVSYAGKEVEKAARGFFVCILKVKYHGASVEKMICDLRNIVEAIGLNDLEFERAAAYLHAVILTLGCIRLLVGLCGLMIHLSIVKIVLKLLSVKILIVVASVVFGVYSALNLVKKSHKIVPPIYLLIIIYMFLFG